MKRTALAGLLALALGVGSPPGVEAQEQSDFLSVGEMAPDITFTGATRHGVLMDELTLEELRGETVVLAFFFKARTGG